MCAALLGSSLWAVAPAAAQTVTEQKLPVVATFSILGDMVRNVGGDRIRLTTLVGANADAHVYAPTPADAKAVADARVVVTNGLRFEGWIDRLIKASGTKATVVQATRGVKTIKEQAGHGHGHSHGHSHGGVDPHAWQSVENAIIYVANIRDGLIGADPAGKAEYEANAARYTAELQALHAELKALTAKLPSDRRKVITGHDAFGYFEAAYGLTFLSPQGVSTESEASARDVARIIAQIKREKVGAVFLENVSDPRLVKRIADETGARVGGTLFSDALSAADGPAATYVAMMRHNITTLTDALMPKS
jgi:zinc/manganese transport system substrate-binding protein